MKKMNGLAVMILLSLCIALLSGIRGEAGNKKPNFIVILTDDLGFNQIGAYGDTPIGILELVPDPGHGRIAVVLGPVSQPCADENLYSHILVTDLVLGDSEGEDLRPCIPQRFINSAESVEKPGDRGLDFRVGSHAESELALRTRETTGALDEGAPESR